MLQILRPIYSHQVESPQNGIIIVGVGQNKLVLELGANPIIPLDRALDIGELVGVPSARPEENVDAVPSGGVVLERMLNLLEAVGGVVQKSALLSPARVVVQSLKNDAVNINSVASVGELLVKATIVVLGEVDGDVESDAGESLLKGLLEGVLLVCLVSAVPNGDNIAFLQSGLVDLIKASSLVLDLVVKAQDLVIAKDAPGEEASGQKISQHVED
jgi:hypothetical protein